MQRSKYAPEFKDEAVKQVIDKGHSVVDVAKRLGVPDNVLYTWVSKFKKADEPESSDIKAMQAEVAKLKAELRRTTEERDILKKKPRTLPKCPGEVRIHGRAPWAVSPQEYVPGAEGAAQRLLRLEGRTEVAASPNR